MEQLQRSLARIDGRGYPAYKQIKGTYRLEDFDLEIVHVQGDPFAAPSKIAIHVPTAHLAIDPIHIRNPHRRTGLEDAILRSFSSVLKSFGKHRGSGKSGLWGILRIGQEMLPRTACEISEQNLTLRFTLGLPARGRRILAREAKALFFEDLPRIVDEGLWNANADLWVDHALAAEDQDALRDTLLEKGWIGFIANGSILPRASGIEDLPLAHGAVPWQSPPEWEIEVELPNRGTVRGTAVPQGIVLICGGGYHGKSTVLQALARGVYNHVPGDGRELCVCLYESVAIRAEDGRSVCSVDISPFISNLPNKENTKRFSTQNASGSTSQSANIVEALEMGTRCLLIDEDTSATNFMMRDRRMQELIETSKEPITPFIDRVRELHQKLEVSSVLVVGGSGDYFEVSDSVLVMENYLPKLSTERAKQISRQHPSERLKEERPPIHSPTTRFPKPNSFDPSRGNRAERVRAVQTRALSFGRQEIDVSQLTQLIDEGQTKMLGDCLVLLSRDLNNGHRASIRELSEQFESDALKYPLSEVVGAFEGDRVFVRRFELSGAINRLRTLDVE